MGGSRSARSRSTRDLRGLELVFQQGQRVANDLVEVGVAELGGRSAREIQQAVGDLSGAEALLGDLFQHRAEARVALAAALKASAHKTR